MAHPEYSDELLDHFRHPRNVGEIEHPDAEARVTSPVHGDSLRLTFAIRDDRIQEVRFLCLGCPVAIAAGSVATELLTGSTVREALKVTDDDVATALGGLSGTKRECSLLVRKAILRALGTT